MKRQAADFGIKLLLIFIVSFCLFTCGIEEYYFLPQVPDNNIHAQFASSAVLNLDPIPSEHYYATGYRIYYRIYLSSVFASSVDTTQESLRNINSSLASDYTSFYALTDPSNTSSIPTITTFDGRRYYELNYQIDRNGGSFQIIFPNTTDNPTITPANGNHENLLRYPTVIPKNDVNHELYFRNTNGLNMTQNANSGLNMDVASGQVGHAYVAMYIVAVGQNPQNFSRIFGKPTFINIFILPNTF